MKKLFLCLVVVLIACTQSVLWSQQQKLIGVLNTDVSSGETMLGVDWVCAGSVDQPVLIESRNKMESTTGDVIHILGSFLMLKERLGHDFLAGSTLFQDPDVVNCAAKSMAEPMVMDEERQALSVACDPTSITVTAGEATTLAAHASGPDGGSVTYAWSLNGRPLVSDQPSLRFETRGRPIGIHAVSVVVTDVDGMTASCDFSVSIARRADPVLSVSLTLDKSEVYSGETVTASAQASDTDANPVTYSWTLDDQSRSETSSQIEIDTTALAGGRHGVAVTIQDSREGSASDLASFSVRERIVIGMSRIQPDNLAKAKLDEIALKMQQDSQLRALITGHTDDRGDEAANDQVGQRRADAVRDYLVTQHNIDAGRIETSSAGEGQPVADNQTPEGQQENRRAQIELFVP